MSFNISLKYFYKPIDNNGIFLKFFKFIIFMFKIGEITQLKTQ